MKTTLRIALGLLLAALIGCRKGPDQYFEPAPLPEEVVPLYGEAVAYKAKTTADKKATLRFDLRSLVKDSQVDKVVVIPYDAENWYEPTSMKLTGTVLEAELPLNRDFIVALDLGDVAYNNYQAVTAMSILKGMIPDDLQPRICQLILCPAESFRADTLAERLPELAALPIDFESVLPPLPVGPVGRAATVCDRCLDKGTNVLPCLIRNCGKYPAPRKVRVRKNIYSLSQPEIDSLRAGVAAMKARPATDPTSWIYQARMHAVDSGTAAALQDQCQHRQFFFFSWHRMFIYYFERILRQASGDANLTLPYWNYTDVAAQGVLPEAFRLPADSSNPLYNGTRQAVYNGGAALPPADVSYTAAFNLTNFTTPTLGNPSFGGRTVAAPAHFPASSGSGQLERSPHNNVHNDVGGEMATGESPRDPIFWLHHANIDRLWKRWIALGNGRTNPTGDSTWMDHTFSFFDENGTQVSLKGSQILNTVSQLDYRYDDDPLVLWPFFKEIAILALAPEERVAAPEIIAEIKQPVRLTEARRDLPLRLPQRSRDSLVRSLEGKFEKERLILQLRNIQYDEPVGVTYLLFLNLPADARDPDHTHPSFIGTLGFFGKTESPEHAHAAEAGGLAEDYDITAVVRKLGRIDDLRLSVVPSYPRVPADRKDLQEMVARMRPKGSPRFGEIVLMRLRRE